MYVTMCVAYVYRAVYGMSYIASVIRGGYSWTHIGGSGGVLQHASRGERDVYRHLSMCVSCYMRRVIASRNTVS